MQRMFTKRREALNEAGMTVYASTLRVVQAKRQKMRGYVRCPTHVNVKKLRRARQPPGGGEKGSNPVSLARRTEQSTYTH